MEQTSTLAPMSASSCTILVVEDEPLIRLFGTLVLADAGYKVLEASNAEEALRVLESQSEIDLVFTDVDMPGALNGFGLARCVHERWPEVSVIVTSGSVQERPSSLADPFVAKPYAASVLMSQIATALALPAA